MGGGPPIGIAPAGPPSDGGGPPNDGGGPPMPPIGGGPPNDGGPPRDGGPPAPPMGTPDCGAGMVPRGPLNGGGGWILGGGPGGPALGPLGPGARPSIGGPALRAWMSAPHPRQKRISSGFSLPHRGQLTFTATSQPRGEPLREGPAKLPPSR